MKLEMQFGLDMFVPLRTGQRMLTFDLASPRNAAPPPHVPVHMQQGLLKDDELVFSVVVPPGAGVCSWYTQFNNKIAKFSVDGVTWHSTETLFNTSLQTTPKEVFLGVKIQEVRSDDPACLLGIALTIGIEDAALYTNWINSGKPMQVQPEPPTDHKALALKELESLAIQSELIRPLMDFGACTDMQEFLTKLDRTHTIDALLRFVELAKK